MYDINRRTQFNTVGDLKKLLENISDDTKIVITGDDYCWFHIKENESVVCLDCEDLEECYEEGIIYDDTQDAYICSSCGAYIVDRVDSKDIDYQFPKSCSECHCEFENNNKRDTQKALVYLNEAYMMGRETGHPLYWEDWEGIKDDLADLNYDYGVVKARFDELCNM